MAKKEKLSPAGHAALSGGVLGLTPLSALGSYLQHKAGEGLGVENDDRTVGDYAKTMGAGGAAMGAGAGALGGPALLRFLLEQEGKRGAALGGLTSREGQLARHLSLVKPKAPGLAEKLGKLKYLKAGGAGALAGLAGGGLAGLLNGVLASGSDALIED